jgi:hypothetical protein
MRRYAEVSRCRLYRYLLERHWNELVPMKSASVLTVCMLNPSKADGEKDDSTVRWLIGWAKKRDYDALRVVNMAAYRSSSTRVMLAASDPHGPLNGSYLRAYTAGKEVMCAWGALGPRLPRFKDMLNELRYAHMMCLGTTKNGQPVHPLRKSHALELRPWS